MKIVLVGPAYPLRGGISQYTSALYQALARRHQVLLVSFSRQYPSLLFPGHTQEDRSVSAVQVPSEPLLDTLRPHTWKMASRRILAFKPDFVLFQWWHPYFGPTMASMARHLKRKSPVALLALCHNILSHEKGRFPGSECLERLLARRALKRIDAFLVHSWKLFPEIQKLRPGAPIRHIYHPLYDFYANWEGALKPAPRGGEERGKPVILFFGKIRKYKGLEVLLRALSLVRNRIQFRAVIAGEFYGADRPLKKMAEEFGVGDCLTWEDRYIPNHEVPGLFRRADLVVLPYRQATQSGVVPLAYFFEVPVIASDVGGLSEIVIHEKTGYLVPPGDPQALAEKIVYYFREKKKAEFQEGIRQFKGHLNWEQVIDNLLALSQEIAGKFEEVQGHDPFVS